MNQTTFQPAEIYDSNGNLIQQGAYGINTPFCTSTGDGVYDYIVNNLNALKDMIAAGYIAVATLPASGQINKYYVITEGANAGKCYIWTGTAWQELATQINGKSAYEIAVDHGFIGTEQQWLDSFTADAIAAANRAEAVQAQMEEKFGILDNVDARFGNIEDHAKMTDSNVDATKKRISNVEKLLQGNLYDYQTDETVAYEKTVPAGAMPYAGIEKIGGKTVVWNQLANFNGITAQTNNGVTFTPNVDGSYTINGTATGRVTNSAPAFSRLNVVSGHKYSFVLSQPLNNLRLRFGGGMNPDFVTQSAIVACNSNVSLYAYFDSVTDVSSTEYNQNLFITIFDLTLMFGSGNEPSTVEEFKSMFPADYYPYNAGTLLSAGVTEVVSKKSDTTTLATYSVPAEIQALEGYGWSAGSVYNYIDYERKVFVKNVGRVVIDENTSLSYNSTYDFYTTAANSVNPAGLAWDYKIVNTWIPMQTAPPPIISDLWLQLDGTGGAVRICNKQYTTEESFKAWLTANPLTIYYELATPIETDISAYLTDDNIINVESGGTLTFPNANGDDYHIPVPSDVTYMIDLQEAVSNG